MTRANDTTGGVLGPLRGTLDRIGRWLEEHPRETDGLMYMLEQAAAAPVEGETAPERFFRGLMPPNWWELTPSEQVEAKTLVEETGLPLIWVPRSNVVRAMVLAGGDKNARDAALTAMRELVIEDVDAILRECTAERVASLADAGLEAAAAAHHGHSRASQALAAAIVGEVLAVHFGLPKFAQARARLEDELPAAVSQRFWRRASLQSGLLAAIATSWTDPPPEGFNRHLSAHGVAPDQYTETNALEALLLVGGIVRELHEVYSQGHGGIPPLPTFVTR
jgi:hypothetical protein